MSFSGLDCFRELVALVWWSKYKSKINRTARSPCERREIISRNSLLNRPRQTFDTVLSVEFFASKRSEGSLQKTRVWTATRSALQQYSRPFTQIYSLSVFIERMPVKLFRSFVYARHVTFWFFEVDGGSVKASHLALSCNSGTHPALPPSSLPLCYVTLNFQSSPLLQIHFLSHWPWTYTKKKKKHKIRGRHFRRHYGSSTGRRIIHPRRSYKTSANIKYWGLATSRLSQSQHIKRVICSF